MQSSRLEDAGNKSDRRTCFAAVLLAGIWDRHFFTARWVFSENAAFLSAIIYWLLPLEVMNSVVVKTEPLNTLIFSCGVYFLIRGLQNGSTVGWWISGTLAAFAFYVREFALVVPFVALVIFLLVFFRRKDAVLRTLAALKDLNLKDGHYRLMIYHASSNDHTTDPVEIREGRGVIHLSLFRADLAPLIR